MNDTIAELMDTISRLEELQVDLAPSLEKSKLIEILEQFDTLTDRLTEQSLPAPPADKPILTPTRQAKVEQAITDLEAQGKTATNRAIHAAIGGDYGGLAAYMKQRRANPPTAPSGNGNGTAHIPAAPELQTAAAPGQATVWQPPEIPGDDHRTMLAKLIRELQQECRALEAERDQLRNQAASLYRNDDVQRFNRRMAQVQGGIERANRDVQQFAGELARLG